MMIRRCLLAGGMTLLLLGAGAVAGTVSGRMPDADRTEADRAGTAGPGPAPVDPLARTVDPLARTVDRAQQRLRRLPGDWAAWASLGVAYLEQARASADPTLYPKAEGALRESLRLRPSGNDAALAGLGALANARHDFGRARRLGQEALTVNPYSAEAVAVMVDAHTQLGEDAAATEAVQRMLDLRPALPAYARAAYDLEQRGRTRAAEELWRRALAAAVAPDEIAVVRAGLGDLAWHAGDLGRAEEEYAAGLAASPGYPPLALGRARVAAARGAGLAQLAGLVRRSPTPGLLIEYAAWLRAAGESSAAATALDWAAAALDLFAANGGADDLAAAELAVARGDAGSAVRSAEREWGRRRHADVADALAWALHLAGRDREALSYARLADARGARDAARAYHLGMIELALGDRSGARRDLARALTYNPHFSPVHGPLAEQALARLVGGR